MGTAARMTRLNLYFEREKRTRETTENVIEFVDRVPHEFQRIRFERKTRSRKNNSGKHSLSLFSSLRALSLSLSLSVFLSLSLSLSLPLSRALSFLLSLALFLSLSLSFALSISLCLSLSHSKILGVVRACHFGTNFSIQMGEGRTLS